MLRRGLPDPSIIRLLEAQKGALNYRVSIYEKCAQQIGKLDAEVGKGLVRFFYFIDGVRDDTRPALFNPDTPHEVRKNTLRWMMDKHLRSGIREGLDLHRRLETEATRHWWVPRR